jgi:hypothetical protein
MAHPYPLTPIQSLILSIQAKKQPEILRKLAVPDEYVEAFAFHGSMRWGEFTFDRTFDRILEMNMGPKVYVLGTSSLYTDDQVCRNASHDANLVESSDLPCGKSGDDKYEAMSSWAYDTRDGFYKRYEERWISIENPEDDFGLFHICNRSVYETGERYATFLELMEAHAAGKPVFGPSTLSWDSYTRIYHTE